MQFQVSEVCVCVCACLFTPLTRGRRKTSLSLSFCISLTQSFCFCLSFSCCSVPLSLYSFFLCLLLFCLHFLFSLSAFLAVDTLNALKLPAFQIELLFNNRFISFQVEQKENGVGLWEKYPETEDQLVAQYIRHEYDGEITDCKLFLSFQ